jgi:hypothetical protein
MGLAPDEVIADCGERTIIHLKARVRTATFLACCHLSLWPSVAVQALALTLVFILINTLHLALINALLFALVVVCCPGHTPALAFTLRLVVWSRAELAHPG